MQKIFLSFVMLGNCTLLCAMDKEAQLKDMDKDQKLAYYLATNNKVDNIVAKVRALIDEGADVNRRITTQDQAIKIILREQNYTPEELASATSDTRLESWTPLISIADRSFTQISTLEQRYITSALLDAGAQPDGSYQSDNRPEMNGMTARNFAYQSENHKDFIDELLEYEQQQWRKKIAQND